MTAVDMLEFERQWWRHGGMKEQAIRSRFGLNLTVYYRRLNALLDDAGAVAIDAQTVNRLRRMRDGYAARRGSGAGSDRTVVDRLWFEHATGGGNSCGDSFVPGIQDRDGVRHT